MKRVPANLIFFLGPLFLLTIANLLQPDQAGVSALEQRQLKSPPVFTFQRLWSGAYFQEYDAYFGDTFVFRDAFVRTGGSIRDLRGLPNENGAELVVTAGDQGFQGFGQGESSAQESAGTDGEESLDTKNSILVLNDRALEVYQYYPDRAAKYTASLNRFRQRLPQSIRMYSLLAPIQIEFLKNNQYQNLSSPQREAIAAVYDQYDPGITPVDAYRPLQQNSDKYLYFRTDHHWTALGAYYAYTAFIAAAGERPVPLDQFQVEKAEGFLGTTYTRTLSKKLEAVPDTVYVYHPRAKTDFYLYAKPEAEPEKLDMLNMAWAKGRYKYGIFLNGDAPLARVVTDVKNGKIIAVFKDSYGNAFVPYLANHYQEIYIIDPRMFELNVFDFLTAKGVQEILFLNYVPVTSFEDYHLLLDTMTNR